MRCEHFERWVPQKVKHCTSVKGVNCHRETIATYDRPPVAGGNGELTGLKLPETAELSPPGCAVGENVGDLRLTASELEDEDRERER